MEVVRETARTRLQEEDRIEFVDVSVQILHYCFDWGDNRGDLDNIAKPLLDAMCLVVIFNDNQVKEIFLRRTDLARDQISQVAGATPLLAARLNGAPSSEPLTRQGFVYIAVQAPSNMKACHDHR